MPFAGYLDRQQQDDLIDAIMQNDQNWHAMETN